LMSASPSAPSDDTPAGPEAAVLSGLAAGTREASGSSGESG